MKPIPVACGALAFGFLTFLGGWYVGTGDVELDQTVPEAANVALGMDGAAGRSQPADAGLLEPDTRRQVELPSRPAATHGAPADGTHFNVNSNGRQTLTPEELDLYHDEILEIAERRRNSPDEARGEGVAFVEGSDRGVFITPDYVQVFDEGGALIGEGPWVDGKRSGRWKNYGPTGQLELEGDYVAGLAEGLWTKYGADGTVVGEVNAKAGKFHGDCRFYGESEHDERISGYYEHGELVEAHY